MYVMTMEGWTKINSRHSILLETSGVNDIINIIFYSSLLTVAVLKTKVGPSVPTETRKSRSGPVTFYM